MNRHGYAAAALLLWIGLFVSMFYLENLVLSFALAIPTVLAMFAFKFQAAHELQRSRASDREESA